MKKSLVIIALICSFISSCKKDPEILTKIDDSNIVYITIDYTINDIARTDSEPALNEAYNFFREKISSKELMSPYTLTIKFIETSTNDVYTFSWYPGEDNIYLLKPGNYRVTGGRSRSSVNGMTSLSKYGIMFDDTVNIKESGNVVLKANYDCFLIVFDNSKYIKKVILSDGLSGREAFKIEDYYYAFINYHYVPSTTIPAICIDDYIINLNDYPWENGSCYIYYQRSEITEY